MLNNLLGHLFVVAAASGTGKTSLVTALVEHVPNLQVSISHTTRPMRPGEIDQKNYFFIDEVEFKQKLIAQDFLEYAEVFDYYYGTTRQWVEHHLMQGIDIILEIDWQGARQVKLSYPKAINIFILPPSLEVLKQRLEYRGQDTPEVIAKRFSKAQQEMSHYFEYDYLLVNDDFQNTLEQLMTIITCQRLTTEQQSQRYAQLIDELLHRPQDNS